MSRKKPIFDSKQSFIVYYSLEEQTAFLSDEQLGRLFRMMFDYEIRGIMPDSSDELFMCFGFVKTILDINKAEYAARCEENAKNGALGGRGHKRTDTDNDSTDNEPIKQNQSIKIPKQGADFKSERFK